MTIVVDASLAVKWIIAEQDSDKARTFYARFYNEMHAPDLILVEAASSLVRRANEREIAVDDAKEGVIELRSRVSQAVHLHRITPMQTAAAAALAMAIRHPIQDCIYLALADQLGCPLATSDVKFRDRVADPTRVKLLAELV